MAATSHEIVRAWVSVRCPDYRRRVDREVAEFDTDQR